VSHLNFLMAAHDGRGQWPASARRRQRRADDFFIVARIDMFVRVPGEPVHIHQLTPVCSGDVGDQLGAADLVVPSGLSFMMMAARSLLTNSRSPLLTITPTPTARALS
jgi:hypothetical protein